MSGRVARSFVDNAKIIFREMGLEPRIEFIDLPPNLRGKYQYYTRAQMEKVRSAGFTRPLPGLEDGLRLYLRDYLETTDRFR
jgi:ADP-L-glycero-D-manno-heptose 6-epimerase